MDLPAFGRPMTATEPTFTPRVPAAGRRMPGRSYELRFATSERCGSSRGGALSGGAGSTRTRCTRRRSASSTVKSRSYSRWVSPARGMWPRRAARKPPIVVNSSSSGPRPKRSRDRRDALLARDGECVLARLAHRLALVLVLVGDLADDLLEQVLDRHEAGDAAVLVHDDRPSRGGGAGTRAGARTPSWSPGRSTSRARATRWADRRPARIDASVSFTWTMPDDAVDRAARDGHAGVLGRDEEIRERREGRGGVDPDDVGPRRHDLAHARVAEVDDREEQLLLLLLEDAFLAADVDVGLHLFLGRGRRGRAVLRPSRAPRRSGAPGSRAASSSQEAAVTTGSRRVTIFSGSEPAIVPQQHDLGQSQPARKSDAAPGPGRVDAERAEARDDGQKARQQQDLHEDLGRRAHDLDLARAGEQARALGMLLEQAAHLDRRQPIEREREGLEEQEDADSRRPRRRRGSRRAPRCRSAHAGAASSASISPSSVSWSYPSRCRYPCSSSRSISRDAGSPAAPGLPHGVRDRDHDVAEQRPAARGRKREHVGRSVAPAESPVQRAHPSIAAEIDGDLLAGASASPAPPRRSGGAPGPPAARRPRRRGRRPRDRRRAHPALPPGTGRGPRRPRRARRRPRAAGVSPVRRRARSRLNSKPG